MGGSIGKSAATRWRGPRVRPWTTSWLRNPVALVLGVALLVAALLVGATVAAAQQASGTVRDAALQQLRSNRDAGVRALVRQTNELKQAVAATALNAPLAESLGEPAPAALEAAQHELSTLTRTRDAYAATLVDSRGLVVAVYPAQPEMLGRDLSYRDWFKGVTRTGRPYVSEAFQAEGAGNPLVVAVVAPVSAASGSVVGSVAVLWRLDSVRFVIDGARVDDGVVLVVTDQRGEPVAGRLTFDASGQAGPVDISAMTRAALAGHNVSTAVDGNFEEAAPVPGIGWTVTAIEPTEVALAPARVFERNLYLAMGGRLLFVLALTIVALRTVRGRVAANTAMRAAEAALGASQDRLRRAFEGTLEAATSRLCLLEWMVGAPVRAGVLGLWDDSDPTSPRLRVVGQYDPDDLFPPAGDNPLHVEQFPPRFLIDDVGSDAGTLSIVVPVRTRDRDWGLLALIGGIDNAASRATYQHWATLLCASLESERLAEAVRASEERYAHAARATNDGLWEWDAPTGNVYLSPRCCEMLGLPATRPTDRLPGWDQLVHPDDVVAMREGLRSPATGDGEPVKSEFRIRSANGTYRWVQGRALAVSSPDGTLRRIVGSISDIHERRSLADELAENASLTLRKIVELERASRLKSEFLATMSHELRTPLNSVIGFSEALLDGILGELSPSQHEHVGDIFASGQHLLALINDILDLSKVEAGRMDLDLEQADVGLALSSYLSIVRNESATRSISLELDLDEHLGVADLDLRKTKQIVYNLLSNAVKFSAEGGHVSLRARRVPRSSVGTLEGDWPARSFALADNEFGEFVEIRVTDGGIGIAEEDLASLFQSFTQIDSGLTRRFDGTGLGLSMVKQLTELLGGSVAVTSREGAGTCFAAWIPLRAAARSPAIR